MIGLRIDRLMALSMAVCAQEVAFFRLDEITLERPGELAQAELFLGPIAVMEFEGRDAECIPAIEASAAALSDEPSLALAPMLLLPPVRLCVPALTARLRQFRTGTERQRLL